MSRFYGDLQGNRGEATRGGTKSSGIGGHIRGWRVGARVSIDSNGQDEDEVRVSVTGGSSPMGSSGGDYLAIYTRHELTGGLVKELRDALKAIVSNASKNNYRLAKQALTEVDKVLKG